MSAPVSFHLCCRAILAFLLTGCAKHDMKMLGWFSWCHNWVDSAITQLTVTKVTEKRVDRGKQEENREKDETHFELDGGIRHVVRSC